MAYAMVRMRRIKLQSAYVDEGVDSGRRTNGGGQDQLLSAASSYWPAELSVVFTFFPSPVTPIILFSISFYVHFRFVNILFI